MKEKLIKIIKILKGQEIVDKRMISFDFSIVPKLKEGEKVIFRVGGMFPDFVLKGLQTTFNTLFGKGNWAVFVIDEKVSMEIKEIEINSDTTLIDKDTSNEEH